MPGDSNVTYKVDGLRELRAAMREAPKEVKAASRKRLAPIGTRIAKSARARIRKPYVKNPTGATARTIRSSASPLGITLSEGRRDGVRWLEYGGVLQVSDAQRASGVRTKPVVRKVIRSGRFLYPSVLEHMDETNADIEAGLKETFRDLGLNSDA